MANFRVKFMLCPLIEHRALLGITKDASPECVVVTLGKNMILRYRINDQKQVNSWSSRFKLTSPAVYDAFNDKYVAVFNNNQLRMWTKDDNELDKLKIYNFSQPIHSLLPRSSEELLVVYQNGYVEPISIALQQRKEEKLPLIRKYEALEECYIVTNKGTMYAVYFTKTKKNTFVYRIPLSKDFNVVTNNIAITCLSWPQKEDAPHLVGKLVFKEPDANFVITLWSNEQLYMMDLNNKCIEESPGKAIHCLSGINPLSPAAMTQISSNHIAVYGEDPNDEGAALIIFNLHYYVVQSRQHFKLFNNPPRLWHVESSLFVPVGQNLVVAPYKLEKENMADLIGIKMLTGGAHVKDMELKAVSWDSEMQVPEESMPQSIETIIQSSGINGEPEYVTCGYLIPQLIENKDTSSILWCFNNFTDIPEKSLVQVLRFCMEADDTVFEDFASDDNMSVDDDHRENGNWKEGKESEDVDEDGQSENGNNSEEGSEGKKVDENGTNSIKNRISKNPFSPGKSKFLSQVLCMPFNHAFLLTQLQDFNLSSVLQLMQYLHYYLSRKNSYGEEQIKVYANVLNWTNVLLDAHYQKIVLSKDAEVLELFSALRNAVDNQISFVNQLQKLASLILNIKQGQKLKMRKVFTPYSIEVLKLY